MPGLPHLSHLRSPASCQPLLCVVGQPAAASLAKTQVPVALKYFSLTLLSGLGNFLSTCSTDIHVHYPSHLVVLLIYSVELSLTSCRYMLDYLRDTFAQPAAWVLLAALWFRDICYFLYLLMVCLKEGLGLPWCFLITICLQLISGVIFPMYLQMLCVSFWIVSLTLTNPHPHSSYHWAGVSAHYLLQLFGCGWPSWVFILAHISQRDTQVLVAVPYVHYLLLLKTFSHIIQPKWHPYVLALEPFALEQ